MQLRSLTEHQRWTVISAMYTAAEQYRQNALRIAGAADPHVVEQFQTQCREARELAALIEQAENIELSFEGDALMR